MAASIEKKILEPSDSIVVKFSDVASNPEILRQVLLEYGAARVDGVFTPEDTERLKGSLLASLQTIAEKSGGSLDIEDGKLDYDSWKAARDYLPAQTRSGMMQCLVAHLPSMHEVRMNQNLRFIYGSMYGTTELLSSSDGINVRPPMSDREKAKEEKKPNDWSHIDQVFPGMTACIQGAVNLSTTDAGTKVWLKSHLVHDKILKEIGGYDKVDFGNWVKPKPGSEGFEIFERLTSSVGGTPRVTIPSIAGSVTLWLSSTIHYASLPTVGDRVAMYHCFHPATKTSNGWGIPPTKRQATAMKKYFNGNRHSNHWARKMVPKKPGFWRIYSNNPYSETITHWLDNPVEVPGIVNEEADLNDSEKKIYGLIPY